MSKAEKLLDVMQRNPYGYAQTLHFLTYNLNPDGKMDYEQYLLHDVYPLLNEEDFYLVRDLVKESMDIFYDKYYVE